ncbi:4176_t:CDS:1, partial [Gigaspora rosea]
MSEEEEVEKSTQRFMTKAPSEHIPVTKAPSEVILPAGETPSGKHIVFSPSSYNAQLKFEENQPIDVDRSK